MRLGWISAGRWHARVEMFEYAQTRSNDERPQLVATESMASAAYDRHLRRLRNQLALQREQTAEALAKYFPQPTRLNMPKGGLALWVELPQEISVQALFEEALRAQTLGAPGTLFSNSGGFDHYLRINCGAPCSAALDAALKRLGGLARKLGLRRWSLAHRSAAKPGARCALRLLVWRGRGLRCSRLLPLALAR
jgi:DNA-binding transcriptional MocR family regulator